MYNNFTKNNRDKHINIIQLKVSSIILNKKSYNITVFCLLKLKNLFSIKSRDATVTPNTIQ